MNSKVEKVWGSEKWIVNNDLYCGKILSLKKMFRCSLHYHKNKTETFYVLKGQVLLEVDDNAYMLSPGSAVDIYPNQKHRFTGLKDSQIIEFSTHHEDSDSYRDEESKKLSEEEFSILLKEVEKKK